MKKSILLALLLLGSFCAIQSFAAAAKPEEVSTALLKEWASEKFGCKIDEDGDLIVTKNSEIHVSVIAKAKVVRIYSIFDPYQKRSIAEMRELANKFNYDKRFLRVSIGPDGDSVCDYYLIYDGGLDSANFLEVLNWFFALEKAWMNYVIDGTPKAK